jgi:hypothetical protein
MSESTRNSEVADVWNACVRGDYDAARAVLDRRELAARADERVKCAAQCGKNVETACVATEQETRTEVLSEFDGLTRWNMDLANGIRHSPAEAQFRYVDAAEFDALIAKLRGAP